MFQDMIRSGDVDEDMQQHHNDNVEHFKQSIQNLEQADVDKLLARDPASMITMIQVRNMLQIQSYTRTHMLSIHTRSYVSSARPCRFHMSRTSQRLTRAHDAYFPA